MIPAALANAAWWAASAPSAAAFDAALSDPARAQEKILRHFLLKNADTAYGRAHRFAAVSSVEQFQRRVPPIDYEDLQPWIERIRLGENQVLTAEPVRRLVPTGGSTAARKLVPYTASMQSQLNRAIGPWIFDLYRQYPSVMRGPAYWSVTPAGDEALNKPDASAVPIGFDDDADYLGGWRKHLVNSVMAVPGELAKVSSIKSWRYSTLLLLLRRRDLALISVWHPSFLELLLTALEHDWDSLLADVASGGCTVESDLPPAVKAAMISQPLAQRARELANIEPAEVRQIWPGLRVVSCWADANASAAAEALNRRMPSISIQPKGLLATEGVVSIPYRGRHPLAIRSHYLEFENDAGHIHQAARLRLGGIYRVLLTTAGGLCRYRLQDAVKVDGFVDRTPSIRFVGRTGTTSDRLGEKLTERFVNGVLDRMFVEAGRSRPDFALLAPEEDAAGLRYTLYLNAAPVEAMAARLDALLSQNPQYAYCRRLGQLATPRIIRVRADWFHAYTSRLCHEGQRLGDIKAMALSPLHGWTEVLERAAPTY